MLRVPNWMVLICLFLTVPCVFAKKVPRRRHEIIDYLTRLEQGLSGTRDLGAARRLLILRGTMSAAYQI